MSMLSGTAALVTGGVHYGRGAAEAEAVVKEIRDCGSRL
jgi:hypothetical protein